MSTTQVWYGQVQANCSSLKCFSMKDQSLAWVQAFQQLVWLQRLLLICSSFFLSLHSSNSPSRPCQLAERNEYCAFHQAHAAQSFQSLKHMIVSKLWQLAGKKSLQAYALVRCVTSPLLHSLQNKLQWPCCSWIWEKFHRGTGRQKRISHVICTLPVQPTRRHSCLLTLERTHAVHSNGSYKPCVSWNMLIGTRLGDMGTRRMNHPCELA